MAKLTDRQKLNIVAKWNTGNYTKTELAKQYKVNEKVIRELVGKEKPINAEIVEAQTKLELFKKSEKSPTEIQAINNAVAENLKVYQDKEKLRKNVFEAQLEVLAEVRNAIKNKRPVEKLNTGGGTQELVEVEYGSSDYKNFAETIDKIGITLEVAPRHANIKIDNTNANQVTAPTQINIVRDN